MKLRERTTEVEFPAGAMFFLVGLVALMLGVSVGLTPAFRTEPPGPEPTLVQCEIHAIHPSTAGGYILTIELPPDSLLPEPNR